MPSSSIVPKWVVVGLLILNSAHCAAQEVTDAAKPVVFTVQQDHQNMLQQLGITKLRPGRSSDEKSPTVANYDEAKANPYANLPDVLKMANGEQVTTPEQWWATRRPEIVELLEREVYGRIPAAVPHVQWEVRETRAIEAGGKPAIQKHIVGVVDNSVCPEIKVNMGSPHDAVAVVGTDWSRRFLGTGTLSLLIGLGLLCWQWRTDRSRTATGRSGEALEFGHGAIPRT